jgi:hypothetical protein
VADTSHALNALFADTTFRPALFAPPSAARLKTPTWSPAVVDVDFALIATPEETVTGLPNAEQCAGHAEGWAHYLGRLAEIAAGRDPGPDPWHGRTGREWRLSALDIAAFG